MGEHRVFVIPELLEAIILRVPVDDVISTCKAVSKRWRALINTSPHITHYTATGLLPSEENAGGNGAISPAAIACITRFWHKMVAISDEISSTDSLMSGRESQEGPILEKLLSVYKSFDEATLNIVVFLPSSLEYDMFARISGLGRGVTDIRRFVHSYLSKEGPGALCRKYLPEIENDDATVDGRLGHIGFYLCYRFFDQRIHQRQSGSSVLVPIHVDFKRGGAQQGSFEGGATNRLLIFLTIGDDNKLYVRKVATVRRAPSAKISR